MTATSKFKTETYIIFTHMILLIHCTDIDILISNNILWNAY